MEKKTNKAKLEIFKFFEKISFIARLQPIDKIGGNYVLPANSIEICLLGYFCMQNSISAMKTVQNPTIFMKNAKEQKNE